MKTLRNIAAASLALVAIALPSAAQVTTPKEIKTPPLRKLSMPEPKRVQLDNGMVILMMEDHELPLIREHPRRRPRPSRQQSRPH
jgi:zinc protease